MKRRTSVTVLGIISLIFVIASIVLFVVNNLNGDITKLLEAFIASNRDILNRIMFANIGVMSNLVATIAIYVIIVIFLALSLIWIIVDVKRNRHIVWGYLILHLVSSFLLVSCVVPVVKLAYDFIGGTAIFNILDIIFYTVVLLGFVVNVILFVIDMKTGMANNEPLPAFVTEPIAEENKPVYEEIREEKDETPVVEETKEEVYPYEKELEKNSTPAKKANKNNLHQKAAARKTSTIKKEDVKAANTTRKTSTVKKRRCESRSFY